MPDHVDCIGVLRDTRGLRGWALNRLGQARDYRESGGVTDHEVQELINQLGGGARTLVVGGGSGWAGGPSPRQYAQVPCRPPVTATMPVALAGSGQVVHVCPGIWQIKPIGLIRSSALTISGYLRVNNGFDGVLVMLGARTNHWVHISAQEVVSFRTFATGKLAGWGGSTRAVPKVAADGNGFSDAVSAALARPEQIAARLAELDAETQLTGLDQKQVRLRQSGLLIGAELAATRPYWLGLDMVIIGARDQAELYLTALGDQGLKARYEDGEAMICGGFHLVQNSVTGRD